MRSNPILPVSSERLPLSLWNLRKYPKLEYGLALQSFYHGFDGSVYLSDYTSRMVYHLHATIRAEVSQDRIPTRRFIIFITFQSVLSSDLDLLGLNNKVCSTESFVHVS